MKEKVFSIKQLFILYFAILICFYYFSLFFYKNFGIIGIPLTHLFILFIPGIIIALFLKKDLVELYFLRLPSKMIYFFIGLGLWIIAIILSGIFAFFALKFLPEEPELLKSLDYLFSNTTMMSQIIIISIIPAIIEELLFRGLFLSSFLKNTTPFKAIAITSLMFAAMHFSLIKLVPTLILGSVFGYIVYKSNSIIPSIFLHFINNSMSIIGTHLLSDLPLNLNQLIISIKPEITTLIIFLIFIILTNNKLLISRLNNE